MTAREVIAAGVLSDATALWEAIVGHADVYAPDGGNGDPSWRYWPSGELCGKSGELNALAELLINRVLETRDGADDPSNADRKARHIGPPLCSVTGGNIWCIHSLPETTAEW